MSVVVPVISTFDSRGITKAIRDFKKLDGAGQRSAFALLNTDKGVTKIAKSFSKFGAITLGVAGVIGGNLANAAYESQKVMKQTQAIITATGKAAGLTAKQVADLAESMSMKTGVDDEAIQSSLNLLLTFKQVRNELGEGNDVFNRASMAALDLGNVFGSTDAAAKMLGKALSDPTKGVSALARAGVNFTAQQKEQIKALVDSGKTLEAQKLILAEVESQVGGTAAAGVTGFDRMKVAIGNVQEKLGGILIPYIERFANTIIDRVIPVVSTFAEIVGEKGVGAGIIFLSSKIVDVIANMGFLGKAIVGAVAAFAALRIAAVTYTASMSALNVITTLSDGALKALVVRLGAARIAMVAAGGVVALLSVAAVAYGVYAKRKSDATQATKNFRDALQLEGKAQEEALLQLYKNDKNYRMHIDTLKTMNITLGEANSFIQTGQGSLKRLVDEWNKADSSVKGINPKLLAYAEALGISTDKGLGQVAMVRNMVQEMVKQRQETLSNARAQANLAIAMGNATEASLIMQRAMGMDPSLKLTAADATDALTNAEKDLEKIMSELGGGGSTGGKGVIKTAQERFKEYTNALKGFGNDQKSYNSAIKDTTKAKLKLVEATDAVSVAQGRYDQIVRGYGAGSDQAKTAQEALEQAQRNHTRATFDSEKAAFAVTEAEKELADLRADETATAQQIREAEIALQEAKFAQTEQTIALRDANNEVIEAQRILNEVVNGATIDSQTYKTALEELNEAKAAEVDAANSVTEAIDREAEAKLRLADAERELDAARKGTTTKQREKAETRTGVSDIKGKRVDFLAMVNKQFGKDWKSIQAYIDAGTTATSRANRKKRFNDYAVKEGIPQMAKGGIVSQPTFALIGEKSPEAVVPLDRLAGGGDTYIININSKIADDSLPDLIVAELRKFNRRSGAINIQVA